MCYSAVPQRNAHFIISANPSHRKNYYLHNFQCKFQIAKPSQFTWSKWAYRFMAFQALNEETPTYPNLPTILLPRASRPWGQSPWFARADDYHHHHHQLLLLLQELEIIKLSSTSATITITASPVHTYMWMFFCLSAVNCPGYVPHIWSHISSHLFCVLISLFAVVPRIALRDLFPSVYHCSVVRHPFRVHTQKELCKQENTHRSTCCPPSSTRLSFVHKRYHFGQLTEARRLTRYWTDRGDLE